MARQVLRGYRWGSPTSDVDRGARPAPRVEVRFACREGHEFSMPFSADAERPTAWTCPRHGIEHCPRVNTDTGWHPPEGKPRRTPYVMLLERRSVADLETLLDQALASIDRHRHSLHAPIVIGGQTYGFRFDS